MKHIKLPSQKEIKELFDYNTNSGELIRIKRTARRTKVGEVAGSFSSNGYSNVTIAGIKYQSHRIIYKLYYGDFNENFEIDHIDHDRSNNRIENLRAVTHKVNCKNRKLSKNNTSGHIGVSWDGLTGSWHARIIKKGKPLHLGFFTKIEDAISARRTAELKYKFHPNHGEK